MKRMNSKRTCRGWMIKQMELNMPLIVEGKDFKMSKNQFAVLVAHHSMRNLRETLEMDFRRAVELLMRSIVSAS